MKESLDGYDGETPVVLPISADEYKEAMDSKPVKKWMEWMASSLAADSTHRFVGEVPLVGVWSKVRPLVNTTDKSGISTQAFARCQPLPLRV